MTLIRDLDVEGYKWWQILIGIFLFVLSGIFIGIVIAQQGLQPWIAAVVGGVSIAGVSASVSLYMCARRANRCNLPCCK